MVNKESEAIKLFDFKVQSFLSTPQLFVLSHLLLIGALKNYIKKHKNKFYEISLEKRMEYIENSIQRDIKFRNTLKGMVIGLFTEEEYETYLQDSTTFNKRIMHLLIKRLQNQIETLELEISID